MISGLKCAQLKLARASEHLKEIDHYVAAYAQRVLHEVVTDAKGKKTIHVREIPPVEIGILAGELLYQIRSSLDYLAFDLVKLNPTGYTLPVDWEKNCCFPLWLNRPKKPPTYNAFEHILPGISKPAFAFIEATQPYHRGDEIFAPAYILWVLAELSNIDKHRHLNLTALNIGHMQSVTTKVGMGHFVYRTLRNGAEIKPPLPAREMADAVEVQTDFSSYVTFDEPSLPPMVRQFSLNLILQFCHNTVEAIIVPAFRQFLEKS